MKYQTTIGDTDYIDRLTYRQTELRLWQLSQISQKWTSEWFALVKHRAGLERKSLENKLSYVTGNAYIYNVIKREKI